MFKEVDKKDPKIVARKEKSNVDHILVKDYVREIEIGAFQTEYGVTQRVSFNVILEVIPKDFPFHDNVDLVLSYDNIIEIIEDELRNRRVALLETLAEHIALSCLCLESVITATVRLEKLDRGIGKLGVQIIRTKSELNNLNKNLREFSKGSLILKNRIRNVGLLFVSKKVLSRDNLYRLKNFIANSKKTWIICLPEILDEFSTMNPETDTEIMLMAIAQNAFKLNKEFSKWKIVQTKTEAAFLLKEGVTCIWCPSSFNKFSKMQLFFEEKFALSVAFHLAKELFMKKLYIFAEDKVSSVLITKIQQKKLPSSVAWTDL